MVHAPCNITVFWKVNLFRHKQTKRNNSKIFLVLDFEIQRFEEIFENKKSKFDVVQFHSFLKGQPPFFCKVNKQKEATAKLWGIGFLVLWRVWQRNLMQFPFRLLSYCCCINLSKLKRLVMDLPKKYPNKTPRRTIVLLRELRNRTDSRDSSI